MTLIEVLNLEHSEEDFKFFHSLYKRFGNVRISLQYFRSQRNEKPLHEENEQTDNRSTSRAQLYHVNTNI